MLLMIVCLTISTPVWATDIPDASSASALLFSQRCSACHSLPHPKRLDWPHWRSMLHVMKQRMDERDMSMPVEEWQQIAGYLKSHAR
jgi:hypothetical protein